MTTTDFESEYTDFEERFHRRGAVATAVERLRGLPPTGRIPSQAEIDRLREALSPPSLLRCVADDRGPARRPKECKYESPGTCGNRCSGSYWLAHGEDVASNMKMVAEFLGPSETPEWYAAAGLVHDIDYLAFPHHNALVDSSAAHPMTVVAVLMKLQCDPNFCLAILEHAPHTGLRPTSALSHALVASDEYSTITGSGQSPRFSDLIPADLADCFIRPSTVKIKGFVRPDVQERLNQSLAALADYREWRLSEGPRPTWLPAA